MADARENMLADGEGMFDPEEATDRLEANYHEFDINTIRNTYLGIKCKMDQSSVKPEFPI